MTRPIISIVTAAFFLVLHAVDLAAQTLPVLGYVAAKNANPKRLDVFKQGLTELGLVEGKTIRIEYREAVLDAEYHAVMAELVSQKVDIILAANVAATVAAAKATSETTARFRRCHVTDRISDGKLNETIVIADKIALVAAGGANVGSRPWMTA